MVVRIQLKTKDNSDVDLDVLQAGINLSGRDKLLRDRASRRVAMKRLYQRHPVTITCQEGVSKCNNMVGASFILFLILYRICSKRSRDRAARVKIYNRVLVVHAIKADKADHAQIKGGSVTKSSEHKADSSVVTSDKAKAVGSTSKYRPSDVEASYSSKVTASTTPTLAVMVGVFDVRGHMRYLRAIIQRHLLLSGDVELNPGPLEIEEILSTVDDTTLGEDNLYIVVMECSSLAAKWMQLSMCLGLRSSLIDSIRYNYPSDSSVCWNEALKQWIQRSYNTKKFGLPSWRTLLRSVAIVDLRMFETLAKSHQTPGLKGEEDNHIAAIEQAIKNKGKLDHTVMQGVFLGPARSGKSSLIKRLLKKELNPTSPSTGAADKVIQVSVKKSSSIATSVFESTWLHLTYSGEAIRLMMLAAKTYENKPVSSGRIAIQLSSGDHTVASVPVEMPAGYVPPRETFESALSTGGIVALRQHLDGSWTLYLSDTGGQMEFQELLPLLVSGPSLFFIIFPLHRDLDELFTIQYELPDGQRSEPYQSSLTLKEAILQSLATIAAMGTFTYKGVGNDSVELKPKVLLVGTHKDLLNLATVEEDIKMKDRELRQMITTKSYYRENLIESASKNQLIFTVNNLAEGDDDFAAIRTRVNTIAKLSRYQMSIPTHWLIFSLVIRSLSDRVISYDQCYNVAQQCGIDSEEELKEALWFLHTKMGVIRYFPYGDLSEIVIIDPQLLFDRVTDLIVKTFTFENAGMLLSDDFEKKGVFFLKDFEQINPTPDPLLTHSRFLELLKHLRIIVPFLNGVKFFIPCVLAHANKALDPPRQHSAVPTLAIVFDCGYCPKGVTGTVIKYLMTNEMRSKFVWKLQEDQIFRDQVSFFVGPNLITLCLYPTHFEVVYAPSTEHAEAICSIKETCHEICQSIKSAIQTVSKDINMMCHCDTTFYCTLCKSHIAELVQHRGIPCQLWCSETRQVCDFPVGYHYWFESAPHAERAKSTGSTSAFTTTVTLPAAYRIVFSLAHKWKNLGLLLGIESLNKIEHDYVAADDRLREMLCAWLKQVNPPPSWQALADAVEPFDSATAKKIHTTYCNA